MLVVAIVSTPSLQYHIIQNVLRQYIACIQHTNFLRLVFYLSLIIGHTEEVNQTHYNYDIMELTIKKSTLESICAIST